MKRLLVAFANTIAAAVFFGLVALTLAAVIGL